MRTAFFIAMREVQERRAVLAAALVAGLLPFASPLVPGVSAERAVEARDAMAALLSLGFGLILALLLGATVVARDLAESRLGFDFARPISGLAIWSGRFGAALGLTLGAMAIVAAPASIVGGHLSLPGRGETVWKLWALVLCAVLIVIGLAHFASVAFRSRSRWLALDLVGLVIVLLLAAGGVRRIHDAFAVGTGFFVALVAVVATIPALWIASAAQVVRGRTDLVLGHRAQSLALWAMLLVVALGVQGYSLWFVAVDVEDLAYAWVEPAPQGPWITLKGTVRARPGLEAQFLLDTASGRSVRLGPGDPRTGNGTLYSRDGRRAVWMRRESTSDSTFEVSLIDLDAPDPRMRETSIAFNLLMPIRADISPSGERLMTLQGKSLAVHELETGRILAAATLDTVEQDGGRLRVAFVDENRARVYVFRERLVAYELDVAGRGVTSWTGPEVGQAYPLLGWRPDHERLILANRDEPGILLIDGASGATIATLAPPDAEPKPRCAFLADGRIARMAGGSSGRATLDLLNPDGEPLDSFDLGAIGPTELFWLGAEAAPGTLLVGLSQFWETDGASEGRLLLVDLDGGTIREVENGGGRPVAAMSWIAQALPAQPGSVAARIVVRQNAVWLLDADTATLRHLAGRRGQAHS